MAAIRGVFPVGCSTSCFSVCCSGSRAKLLVREMETPAFWRRGCAPISELRLACRCAAFNPLDDFAQKPDPWRVMVLPEFEAQWKLPQLLQATQVHFAKSDTEFLEAVVIYYFFACSHNKLRNVGAVMTAGVYRPKGNCSWIFAGLVAGGSNILPKLRCTKGCEARSSVLPSIGLAEELHRKTAGPQNTRRLSSPAVAFVTYGEGGRCEFRCQRCCRR